MRNTAPIHVRLASGATACGAAPHYSDVSRDRAEAVLGGFDCKHPHVVRVSKDAVCASCVRSVFLSGGPRDPSEQYESAGSAAGAALVEIERAVLQLQAQARALAGKAAAGRWDAVGSLRHFSQVLGELVNPDGAQRPW